MGVRILVLLLVGVLASAPLAAQGRQVIPGPMPDLPFSAAVRADGLVYVAGMLSQEGGDIRTQTKKTLDDISAVLQRAGSSLANVASVTVYLTRRDDFAAMNEVYSTYWPSDPPVRTTILADLVIPGALVEIAVVAIPLGGERVVIHPRDWMRPQNPYSYGIRTGDTLFLAGLVSRNGRDNTLVEGDMTTQTRTVLDNARQILTAAGFTTDHVVSSRIYIADVARFQDMNAVYRTFFQQEPPARATVLAGLVNPQFQVEITLTAVRAPKTVITTPAADGTPGKPSPLLSSAVKVGNRLYLAGILGHSAATKGDMEAQSREALARIGRTLTAAGFSWTDVVDGVVYITDVAQFAAMNRGYRSVFTTGFPARATVRTGLVAPDGLVEIMFTAVK